VKMLSPVSIRTWQNGICYLASQQQDSQRWIAVLGSTVVTNVRIEKWHICMSLDDQTNSTKIMKPKTFTPARWHFSTASRTPGLRGSCSYKNP
jgi:hypothetical protein